MHAKNITSHFIAVALKLNVFVDLFVELQQLIVREKLLGVHLVNPLSLHLTLYYLPKEIEDPVICQSIAEANKQLANDEMYMAGFNYFQDNMGQENLLYISIADLWPKRLHAFFSHTFNHSELVDNSYDFVPHISILKIEDAAGYMRQKAQIEQIVQSFIQTNVQQNIFSNIHLFEACSRFQPEIQIRKY